MASLLGQFFTSIRGSQEDIASKSIAYILENSKSAKSAINNIIQNKTNLVLNEIKYLTQNVGKNKERPDLSGIDNKGNEKIIIEAKFWSSLTSNQPVEYLNRLKENTALIFICPKLREISLFSEIISKINESKLLFTINNNTIIVTENKYVFIIDWMYILETIKQSLLENNEIAYASDVDQIIGFCEIIDNNTFLPIQDNDLSPSIARRINSYYDLIDKVFDKLKIELNANKGSNGRLQTIGQKHGYTCYFMIDNYCITLEVNYTLWQKFADTPFWIAINTEWGKPQSIELIEKIKKLSIIINNRIFEFEKFNLLYFALKPKLNEVEEIVIDDITNQIITIIKGLS